MLFRKGLRANRAKPDLQRADGRRAAAHVAIHCSLARIAHAAHAMRRGHQAVPAARVLRAEHVPTLWMEPQFVGGGSVYPGAPQSVAIQESTSAAHSAFARIPTVYYRR